jgi:subtilisin family serine protease
MISRYPDLFWIEHNTPMQYAMDMTTDVINATKTWNSVIVDSEMREYPYIQGDGITAVVLDSGIDAGHPDLDYGSVVIKNYKSDSDLGWIELENSDTSSGHGTHCAGTVAGNGDASGGARKGVAPQAKLIGLSTGEAVAILNALGALNWVYEHSKPGHTYEWEDPIRVVSNSWGPSPGDYQPEDAVSIITQKITFENNVVIVFAASNSGGDGSDIQTNPYGNVPSNIAVAAFQRDGSGIASFSSRGQDGILTTYPDVGAPGVTIWSTAARRTMISLMTKQNQQLSDIDPYYFAISGTSMATPHISGVVALILSAYPDLGMSDVYEDAEAEKQSSWNNGVGWKNDTRNRVHEVELILEATARYTGPSDDATPLAENNIPQNHSTGWNGAPFDLSQGYGLVQVDRAIGLALTLKELRTRDFDGDGAPDHPHATVLDALAQYERTMKRDIKDINTDRVYAAWDGEWSRFSNRTDQIIPMNHDPSKLVLVPEGISEMELTLTYSPLSAELRGIVSLYATIDKDGDGAPDWTQSGSPLSSARTDVLEVSESDWGSIWSVNVEGRGIDWKLGDRIRDTQYREVRCEFTVSLNATFSPGTHMLPISDEHAKMAKWKPLDTGSSSSELRYERNIYDLGEVATIGGPEHPESGSSPFIWLMVLLAAAIVCATAFYLIRRRKAHKA